MVQTDTTRTFGSSAARPSAGSGNTSAASFTAGQREANPFSSTSSYTPPQVAAPAPAPAAKSGAVIAGYATSPSAFDSHSTPTQPVLPVATQEPTAASTFPVDVVPQHKPAGAGNGAVPRQGPSGSPPVSCPNPLLTHLTSPLHCYQSAAVWLLHIRPHAAGRHQDSCACVACADICKSYCCSSPRAMTDANHHKPPHSCCLSSS